MGMVICNGDHKKAPPIRSGVERAWHKPWPCALEPAVPSPAGSCLFAGVQELAVGSES